MSENSSAISTSPLLRWAEFLMGLFAAITMFFLMALVCVDVFGRYLFASPLPGAAELTELSMGLLVFGALPLVTAREEHISIGLMEIFSWRHTKFVQRLVMLLISGMGLAVMSWRVWLTASQKASYGDTSLYLGIPLAPLAYFISIMAAIAAVITLVKIVQLRNPTP